jgi:hypothetical protein
MQKHRFGVTCPDTLFLESVPVPHEQEKLDVKIQVWCTVSQRVFSGIHTGPTQARKIVRRRFTPRTHRNALRGPQIIPDAKHKFGVTCPDALFAESAPVPHEHEK